MVGLKDPKGMFEFTLCSQLYAQRKLGFVPHANNEMPFKLV